MAYALSKVKQPKRLSTTWADTESQEAFEGGF